MIGLLLGAALAAVTFVPSMLADGTIGSVELSAPMARLERATRVWRILLFGLLVLLAPAVVTGLVDRLLFLTGMFVVASPMLLRHRGSADDG